ncbi:MAG: TIGR03808 family TAT-translocated repetitive protein [Methyloceanibacter sp.]|uniref:TIGR03808 family TAT-translocated repetitive protein n=1 Tax=Methyloceanibacter sp. TaxID=1965321 RepID=UPI001DD2C6CE|nr:TIGR03808 family TAT-translocated repetitive protein [Methyloceanibacter sp.]MCB1443484.1 TIGR03808 family TAT-translocated repetitive protein [Methyloceanibacter sp.]
MTGSPKKPNSGGGLQIGRRDALFAGLGTGFGTLGLGAGPSAAKPRMAEAAGAYSTHGIVPADGAIAQTATLQAALDAAANSGTPLFLPAGTYMTDTLEMKRGAQVHGIPGRTVLKSGGATIFTAENAENLRLSGLVLDGGGRSLGDDGALLFATGIADLDISDCRFVNSGGGGVTLRKTSGRIANCTFGKIATAALFSEDATGLEISHNQIHDCGDNGILVWRSEQGEDGTLVCGNRIERIAAKSGGSGQNGNGVNVFRAGSVLVAQNRISDCAFSAIRSNAGSNCQMIANSCARLGEVALYAEFGFEGAVIANNIVDTAATGISVTNFNEGGRLAVVQGNLIRNLFLRKTGEARGNGISVEADTTVSGNVVEGAPAYGIIVGWGDYLRDVAVTGNVIRKSHIGIGVAVGTGAGTALVTDNLIDGARDGAIRAMKGPAPLGPDLALESAEPFRNLAVYANVAR